MTNKWIGKQTRLKGLSFSRHLFHHIIGGNCCKVAGWGQIADNETYATELQEVGVPVFDLKTCRENHIKTFESAGSNIYPKVTNDTFCAGADGRDSCFVSYQALACTMNMIFNAA